MKKILMISALILTLLTIAACNTTDQHSAGNIAITVSTDVPIYSIGLTSEGTSDNAGHADGSQLAQGETIYFDLHPERTTVYTITVYNHIQQSICQHDFTLSGTGDEERAFTITGLPGGLIINEI